VVGVLGVTALAEARSVAAEDAALDQKVAAFSRAAATAGAI